MTDKEKKNNREFQERSREHIEFKAKKLNSLFDKWMDNRFIEEVTLNDERKIKSTRK